MPTERRRGWVRVRLAVTVYVDPIDPTLSELRRDKDRLTPPGVVVAAEIVSNLESVPYVRHAAVTNHQSEGGSI